MIVVSVVVGFQNMSISMFVCFRLIDLSWEFIHTLFSYVRLSLCYYVYGLCVN